MDLLEDRSQLRHAYDNALEVFQSLRNMRSMGYDPDRLFIMELATVTMEALDCIDTNAKISFNCFNRISKLAQPNATSKMVKLGYSLVVLLETLLADKCEVGPPAPIAPLGGSQGETVAIPPIEQEPSSSTSPVFVKEEEEEFADEEEHPPILECAAPDHIGEPPATVKEEPIEPGDVKVEEPDEFTEVKDEPIVDFYCPTTGTARPPDALFPMEQDPCNFRQSLESDPLLEDGRCKAIPGQMSMSTGSRPIRNAHSPGSRSFEYLALRQTSHPQECSLCHRHVNKFYSTCSLDTFIRNKLFDAIRFRDTIHKGRVEELRASDEIAIFCLGHFPAAMQPQLPPKTEPISLVRPRRTIPKIAPDMAHRTLDGKFAHCYLCGLASDNLLAIPTQKEARNLFIARIKKNTPADLERMSALHVRDKALFCQAHLRPWRTDGNQTEDSLAPIVKVEKPTVETAPKRRYAGRATDIQNYPMVSRGIFSVDPEEWTKARKYAQEACQSFQISKNSDEELLTYLSSIVLEIFEYLDPHTDAQLPDFDSISLIFSDAQTPLVKFGLSISVLLKKLMSDRVRCVSYNSLPLEQDEQSFITQETVIKEEPLEIKEEFPDDFQFANQEEPEPELFCPATGSSRPLDEMDYFAYEEVNDEPDTMSEEVGMSYRKRASHDKFMLSLELPSTSAPMLQPSERSRRLCYLCKQTADSFRKFPPNTRPMVQLEWIERLGRSARDSRRLLGIYQGKIVHGVDIRWCSRHFDSHSIGLPTDLRPIISSHYSIPRIIARSRAVNKRVKLMTSRVTSSIDPEQWSNARKYASEACHDFLISNNTDDNRMLMQLSSIVLKIFDCLDTDTDTQLPDFDGHFSQFSDAQTPLVKFGLSLSVLLKGLLNDRMPCETVDSPPAAQDTLQNSIKSEPIEQSLQLFDTHETVIKHEPLDIKEEPLDDFEQIKQEEPESEFFCPATGSSRPLNEMDFLAEMNEDPGEVSEEDEMTSRKSATTPKQRSSIGRTSKNAIFAPAPQRTERRRLCHLCKQHSDSLRKFPANSRPVVQEQWIERLGKSMEDARQMLVIYRNQIERGADIRWCSEHFNSTSFGLPKDLRPLTSHPDRAKAVPELFQRPATRPTLQVRPLRPELQLERLQQRYLNGLAAAAAAAAMPKTAKSETDSTPKTPRLADGQRQGTPRVLHQKTSGSTVKQPTVQRLKCDLCADPEYPMHLSPSHRLRAKTFLESLITQTDEEQDKVNAMLNNLSKEAKICSKHFWKEAETTIVSPPLTKCAKPEKFDLVQSTLYLLQKKDQDKADSLQDSAQQNSKALNKPPIKRKASDDLF